MGRQRYPVTEPSSSPSSIPVAVARPQSVNSHPPTLSLPVASRAPPCACGGGGQDGLLLPSRENLLSTIHLPRRGSGPSLQLIKAGMAGLAVLVRLDRLCFYTFSSRVAVKPERRCSLHMARTPRLSKSVDAVVTAITAFKVLQQALIAASRH